MSAEELLLECGRELGRTDLQMRPLVDAIVHGAWCDSFDALRELSAEQWAHLRYTDEDGRDLVIPGRLVARVQARLSALSRPLGSPRRPLGSSLGSDAAGSPAGEAQACAVEEAPHVAGATADGTTSLVARLPSKQQGKYTESLGSFDASGAWGDQEEALRKCKATFVAWGAATNNPLRACYGLRLCRGAVVCFALCDRCEPKACTRRLKVVTTPGSVGLVLCCGLCNPLRPAVVRRDARFPLRKRARAAAREALGLGREARSKRPRQIAEQIAEQDGVGTPQAGRCKT